MHVRRAVPSGLLLLVASSVLGLAALLPFSMGVTRLHRDQRLAQDGATVQGTVERLEQVTGGGARTATRVHYSFRAADKAVHRDTQTPTSALVKRLTVGGPVSVRYVRSDPEISEIESRPFIGYLFTTMGTVGLALVLGVFVAGLRQLGAGNGRGFSDATATVTDLEDANHIVDSERYLRVRFQFADASGQDHWGKSPPLPPAQARAHDVGSRVRIRYNPRDPSITRWIE